MKKIVLILLPVFFLACNQETAKNDTDTGVTDGDIPATEETVTDDAVLVENESDLIDDTPVPDVDTDTTDPDCPPLIEAKFPYYKEDGTIHFCRKCDTPTEKDPQCVANLWKEANLKLTTDHPEADCYPYPCVMENLYARTKEQFYTEEPIAPQYVPAHECDLIMANNGWDPDSTGGQIKHWNLSEGKVGFVMYKVQIDINLYVNKRKFFSYDITSQKYTAVSPGDYGFAYQDESAIVYLRDSRSLDHATTYMYIGYFNSDGTYRVVYNKPIDKIVYTPALKDKWAFANISERNLIGGLTTTMYYAKVGEWQWTSLGTGTAYYPDVKGEMLSFYDSAQKGHLCDLSKKPTSLDSCRMVNREGESVRDIVFDKENEGIAAYTNLNKIMLVRYDKYPLEYTELFSDYTGKPDQFLGFIVNMLRGNMLMYTEAYFYGGSTYGGRLCFYRLDTKQRYCMNKMENDKQYGDSVVYPYGDAEFEGDYVLYQKLNSSPLILRDMKCYCEKEGVCPFEGMKK